MKHHIILTSTILTLATTAAIADPTVYLDFGDDSYHLGLVTTPWHSQYGNLVLNPDLIIKDDDEYVVTPGVHWQILTEQSPFIHDVGLGINFYFSHFDNQDVDALAPGAWVRSKNLLDIPLQVVAELHYAPSELTFEDGKNFLDWSAQLEYQLFYSFVLYGGYRQIRAETDDLGERNIDETPYIGAKYIF